jgi:hypothetical protein
VSKPIPDPYYQRIRSAVAGQVVGVVVPTCLIGRTFGVFAGQLINKLISVTLAPPSTVAVQNVPNESPVLTRTTTLSVGFLIPVTAAPVAVPGDEPVIDGGNQSPVVGVAFDVSVLP